jgi:hypothetical protein
MSRKIRRLILAPLAAASLLMTAAGGAFAAVDAAVSVFNADGTPAGAKVCDFYFEFGPAPGGEDGSWELRAAGGTAVAQGSYSVTTADGDREPNTGSLTFPNGTYTLLWDDETPIDNSREELQIVVECDAPTFIQSVAADTEAPERTLPDTTAFDQPAQPDETAWTGLLVIMTGLAAILFVLTPSRRPTRR